MDPSNNTGILSKANLFLKSSAKRLGQRTESVSSISGHVPTSNGRVNVAPDAGDPSPPVYAFEAASASTPSFLSIQDPSGSPSRQLKHAPTFPATKLVPPPSLRQEGSFDSLISGLSRTRNPSVSASTADLTQVPESEEMVAPASTDDTSRGVGNGRGIETLEAPIGFQKGAGSSIGAPTSASSFNPATVYQHIQEVAAKRVSTLDYLRRAHQGQGYWYNTLWISKTDISKMPSFEAKKLARRATNFLLLGLSLPTVLDLNTTNPLDYLRMLNALLGEFESYQQTHSPDGSGSSSLSRARIPQMFKRSNYGAGSKGRRTSSAADIGLPMGTSDPADLKSMVNGVTTPASSTVSFAPSEQELLPGEEYTYLVTPFLPFDPDFYETFATLCDVLIDCYMHVMSLVSSPSSCVLGVGETFSKADARLRKVMISGIVKEFEDVTRTGIKSEVAGIGKVVLGGLV